MARYLDTLPDELQCLVCTLTLPITAFRRIHHPGSSKNTPHPYTVYDGCQSCQLKYKRRQLTPAQLRRWKELGEQSQREHSRNRNAARRNAAATRPRTERGAHMRDIYASKRDALPPFDQAVAELEAEWGTPAAQWTLAQDRLCTLRMYAILGWPAGPDTITDQEHHRRANTEYQRKRRAKLDESADEAIYA